MLYGPDNKPARPIIGQLIEGHGRLQTEEILQDWLNPDELARNEGLISYDDVARDLHTRSVWNTRILALRKCAHTWQPAENEPDAQLHADFVAWNFTQAMRTSLSAVRENVHRSATKNGYAVQEYIWQPDYPRGQYAGRTALVDIRDVDPDRFLIKPDGLYLKRTWSDQRGTKTPAGKFWLITFQPEYGNLYGASLFQEIRWFVWFKKSGFKFWLVFLEKFGMPTVKGVIPENYTNEDEVKRVREVLSTIRGREAITVPAGFDVSLLEATKAGSAGAGYDQLIAVCNREISKGILGQTLTTEEGMSSGSYAQSKTHDSVRDDILQADGEWFDSALNWGPVVTLLDYNFAVSEYPICVTETQPGDDLNALAERDAKLVAAGVRIPQKYFYERYNIPEPQDGEAVAGQSPAMPPNPSGRIPHSLPSPAAPRPEGFAEPKKKAVPTDALYDTALKDGADAFRAQFTNPLRAAIAEAGSFEALQAALDDRSILGNSEDTFTRYLADTMRAAYLLGRWVIQQRVTAPWPLQAERFADAPVPVDTPAGPLDVQILDKPLTNEAALEWLQSHAVLGAYDYDSVAQEIYDAAFRVSGVEDERLLADIKTELERALAEGSTYQDFEEAVTEAFEAYGVDPLNPWHLSTVFRTNIQTAYHTGSWQMLHDPDLGDLIAYLQYDAIEDHRTRPAHAAVDGVTLPLTDDFWNTWYPPNGYNCRCDVLPVTKYDARDRAVAATPKDQIPEQVIVEGEGRRKPRVVDVKPDKGFATAPTI